MVYTVKQLAEIAGVSIRTLHHYDHIGLLAPTTVGQNNYRYYDDEAVLRLQQILFYRELDFSLAEVAAILDQPEFDMLSALQEHKRALQQRIGRLSELIGTIDQTVLHLKGEKTMTAKDMFAGFDETQQPRYEQEIGERFGERELNESRRRWASYGPAEKDEMRREGEAIYGGLVELMGSDPASPEVQALVARWHQHLRWFYEPTPEILQGLGQAYATHPEFVAFYERMHPQMPEFLSSAIAHYCSRIPAAV